MSGWIAMTPDGPAVWVDDGGDWVGTPAVRERVVDRLAGGEWIAVDGGPAFATTLPVGEHALLTALLIEYGPDLVAPEAPWAALVADRSA